MEFQKELIDEFDREVASTRKMLDAIPEEHDGNFKPHPKSFTFGRLTGHVAEMLGVWGVHVLTQDKLEFGPDFKYEPYIPASKTALLERFDKETAEARAALVALDPAKWDDNWQLIGNGQVWVSDTRYRVFRNVVVNHTIHHRAQLGVYLRLQNFRVPGLYGPSADEMPSS